MERFIEAILLVILLVMGFMFLGMAISIGSIGGIIFCSLGIVLTVAWIVEYHLRRNR